MEKGLCLTCSYSKSCILPQRYPVLECEEFSCNGADKRADSPAE